MNAIFSWSLGLRRSYFGRLISKQLFIDGNQPLLIVASFAFQKLQSLPDHRYIFLLIELWLFHWIGRQALLTLPDAVVKLRFRLLFNQSDVVSKVASLWLNLRSSQFVLPDLVCHAQALLLSLKLHLLLLDSLLDDRHVRQLELNLKSGPAALLHFVLLHLNDVREHVLL